MLNLNMLSLNDKVELIYVKKTDMLNYQNVGETPVFTKKCK